MIQLTPDELLTLEALETYRAQDAAAQDIEPWLYYAALVIRGVGGQKAALSGGFSLLQAATQTTINNSDAIAAQIRTNAQNKLNQVTALSASMVDTTVPVNTKP